MQRDEQLILNMAQQAYRFMTSAMPGAHTLNRSEKFLKSLLKACRSAPKESFLPITNLYKYHFKTDRGVKENKSFIKDVKMTRNSAIIMNALTVHTLSPCVSPYSLLPLDLALKNKSINGLTLLKALILLHQLWFQLEKQLGSRILAQDLSGLIVMGYFMQIAPKKVDRLVQLYMGNYSQIGTQRNILSLYLSCENIIGLINREHVFGKGEMELEIRLEMGGDKFVLSEVEVKGEEGEESTPIMNSTNNMISNLIHF